jgi:autotransporter-associated beta strand protein
MIDTGLGDINVQAGSLTITATANAPQNSLGNSSATITVYSNATLTLDTIGTIPAKNFVLTNGGTLRCSGTNTFGDPLTLAGPANNAISVNSSGNQFTITSAIGGSGGFSKNGSGTLFLTANNTYSGSTVISGGTLALYGNGSDGSISSSANINITGGATLDVSGRSDGKLTLASGQTLSGGAGTNGPGLINGSFIAAGGSTVAPGAGTTNVGSVAVSSNATLQSATVMKLNPAGNSSDRFSAYALTYGGTLTVTNANGTITNGQTFQLFVSSNGVYNAGTFSSISLPVAAGLTWTTNLSVDGTITANVVTGPPQQPVITHIGILGADLHLNGSNGPDGSTFYVWASTNLAVPIANWMPIATNSFTGTGTFNVTVTNAVDPNARQSFYIISY